MTRVICIARMTATQLVLGMPSLNGRNLSMYPTLKSPGSRSDRLDAFTAGGRFPTVKTWVGSVWLLGYHTVVIEKPTVTIQLYPQWTVLGNHVIHVFVCCQWHIECCSCACAGWDNPVVMKSPSQALSADEVLYLVLYKGCYCASNLLIP